MPTSPNTFRRVNGAFYRGDEIEGDPTNLRKLFAGEIGYTNEPTSNVDRKVSVGTSTGVGGSKLPSTGGAPQIETPSTPQPMDSFNLLLTDMLKSAQGVSTVDLLKKKRALARASTEVTSTPTPDELKTLSPGQQDAIRTGRSSALSSEIDANAYELEKANQSIDNFFKVHAEAQKLGKDWADKIVAPDSIIENAKKVIEANPESLSNVLAGFNDKTKEKILGTIDYTKMKAKPVSVSAGASLVDPVTGQIIATAPEKGTTPSSSVTLSGFPADIQAAAQSIFDGKSKLNEYPSAKRLQINQAMSKLYTAEGGNELAQGAYNSILTLETHPGFNGAIGAKGLSSLFGLKSKPVEGTQAAGFLKQLETLKANIKLVNIKYLKGTGALSDAEGKTLEDAGTSLDPSLPEEDFKKELARVKAVLLKANNIAQKTTEISVTDPNGGVHKFPDQASADAFKKAAGIKQ